MYIRSDDLAAVVDATVAMMDRVMVGGGIARRKKKKARLTVRRSDQDKGNS